MFLRTFVLWVLPTRGQTVQHCLSQIQGTRARAATHRFLAETEDEQNQHCAVETTNTLRTLREGRSLGLRVSSRFHCFFLRRDFTSLVQGASD